MASNLEEPGRSRALHIINQALKYRNLTPPKPNIPLTIPFLAIPLHLPTHRLREAAHKTLRAHLHNHRTWEGTLHIPPDSSDLPCACAHLKTILLDPTTPTVDDHYILTLDQLTLPPHLRIFLAANMNEQRLLPQQGQILPLVSDCVHQMVANTRPPNLSYTALGALPTHLKQQPRFTARLLRQLQEFLGDQVVLHHADHELQQLRIFCPRQYFTGALHLAVT